MLDNQPSRVSLLNENGDASVRQSRNYNDRSGVRDSNGSIAEIRTTGKKWASVRVGSIKKDPEQNKIKLSGSITENKKKEEVTISDRHSEICMVTLTSLSCL